MMRVSRPPRDALRREILTVAQRLFTTIGFRGTSLQMIADEVGCSKAALLYHFKTKVAILDALIGGLGADFERMLARLADVPEAERLPRTVELSVALVVRHRAALAMLRGLDDLAEISEVIAHGQEWADQARAILAGPGATGAEQAAAYTFEYGVLGTCLALPHLPDDELAAALLEIGGRIFDIDPSSLSNVAL